MFGSSWSFSPISHCANCVVFKERMLHLHSEKILAFAGHAACVPISVTSHIINTGLFCRIFGGFLSMSSSQVGNYSGFYMGLLGLWITNIIFAYLSCVGLLLVCWINYPLWVYLICKRRIHRHAASQKPKLACTEVAMIAPIDHKDGYQLL